ncbi:secretory subunit, partial [Tulasnella sp. 419]
MANYQYDESGVLASYFVLSFLSLVLIPLTLSFIPQSQKSSKVAGCECKHCQEKAAKLRKANRRSIFKPQLGAKALFTAAGWAVFAILAYKVASTKLESTVYDPFAILGISSGTPEKDIKRHYKKLSLKFHPDK